MRNVVQFILIVVFLAGGKCTAQENKEEIYKLFAKDVRNKILYPIELERAMKPTACLIRVTVDLGHSVVEMELSDSADSALKAQFVTVKDKLDTKLLSNYLRLKYFGKNTATYVIPFALSTWDKNAPSQVLEMKDFYKYAVFDGNNLAGEVIFLDPIFRAQGIAKR